MQMFVQFFGLDRIQRGTVVLPTPEFFPDDFHDTPESVAAALARVCGFMDVNPGRLRLELIPDVGRETENALRNSLPHWRESSSRAAGTYTGATDDGKIRIAVKQRQVADPVALIATLAHELGHVVLLSDGRISRDAPDMEPLTDLVTIALGMGIFPANSAIHFSQFTAGDRHGWQTRRLGYLPEPVWGYALAYYAFLRDEERPAWARHLNVNIGTYFKQSSKFIRHDQARRKGR